ncbi:MAG: c-type cytochrome [Deltaproteobacteria bacterium]|nr:c-type cytochrome [Deltaproteobacteria bacterium]MCB9788656.1 c-type cytochrome [Deltaproteobacteria bacterium]
MLSKSAARAFFLIGTVACGGAFIWLTADTMAEVPGRSHADRIDARVVRGHDIWTDKNCMGCHTLLGEGAYYAPELTKVVSRRGEAWIRTFLKDPAAMYPGRRQMVRYDFSDADIDALVAFFTWVEGIDTNGFPAKPIYGDAAKPQSARAAVPEAATKNRPAYFDSMCVACHSLAGSGGNVGPALDGVATRFTRDDMDLWLKDPPAIKPGTKMPNLHLSDELRAELVTFLMAQK